jgi:hypothetical protein
MCLSTESTFEMRKHGDDGIKNDDLTVYCDGRLTERGPPTKSTREDWSIVSHGIG